MQLKLITASFADKILINSVRRCSNSAAKWDIYAGLCLERRPAIVPEMNIIEKTMYSLTLRFEASKSLLSDHEVRKIRDKERMERLASGKEVATEDLDAASMESGQEFEDKFVKELQQFQFAPRTTKADETGDKRSLDRCLDRRLLFCTRWKIDDHYNWFMPFVKIDKQNSLREAADGLVEQIFPQSEIKLQILGNVPTAVYTYKYGKKTQRALGATGAKVFMMKAYHTEGKPNKESLQNPLMDDFMWLTIDEAREILPTQFWKTIRATQFVEGVHPSIVRNAIEVIRKGKEDSEKVASRSN